MHQSVLDLPLPPSDDAQHPYRRPTCAMRLGSAVVDGIMFLALVAVMWVLAVPAVIVMALALKGRTPGKQAFGLYILNKRTGEPPSTGSLLIREVIGKMVLPMILPILFVGYLSTLDLSEGDDTAWAVAYLIVMTMLVSAVYYIAGISFIFFNRERRALWDYLAGTCVRYQPKTKESNPPNPAIGRIEAELKALPGQRRGSYL